MEIDIEIREKCIFFNDSESLECNRNLYIGFFYAKFVYAWQGPLARVPAQVLVPLLLLLY